MKGKILIVDDEKNIRQTLSTHLESEDYEVETAMNGEEGLKEFDKKNYDLVLLDMKLPGVDGIEILKKMKEKKEDIVVIIITAYGTIENSVEAMKLGAFDYIQKPFNPDEISDIVTDVLKRNKFEKKEEDLENFDDYLVYAKKQINKRHFDKAKKALRKAISMKSDNAEVFNLLGIISELKDNEDEAAKYYRTALTLDPSHKGAYSNLERIGEYAKNKEDFSMEE